MLMTLPCVASCSQPLYITSNRKRERNSPGPTSPGQRLYRKSLTYWRSLSSASFSSANRRLSYNPRFRQPIDACLIILVLVSQSASIFTLVFVSQSTSLLITLVLDSQSALAIISLIPSSQSTLCSSQPRSHQSRFHPPISAALHHHCSHQPISFHCH